MKCINHFLPPWERVESPQGALIVSGLRFVEGEEKKKKCRRSLIKANNCLNIISKALWKQLEVKRFRKHEGWRQMKTRGSGAEDEE